MAARGSRRQSRKRRQAGTAPRAVPSPRREERSQRERAAAREQRAQAVSPLGTYGDPPPSPFGGVPVSAIAIFAGAVSLIVGLIQGGGTAVIVGFIVCALGVIEVTAREHFSGYRSHAVLLAGIPSVGIELAIVAALGNSARHRLVLVLAVVPVFAGLLWVLRWRFKIARQARLARPPGA
ncbi:MAG: hypothetical protein ACXVQR_04225 [Solirubrobacteraceae bacterium]